MAAPDQTREEPFGPGMDGLHDWMGKQQWVKDNHGWGEGGGTGPSNDVIREAQSGYGACIMGRNMFGPIRGEWPDSDPWNGWWGENPPYHCPVFVLTHHAREPQVMEGGTTYYFVTDGIESALAQARAVCPEDRDILINGGAQTINQYLKAGHVDEFWLHVVPFTRGEGEDPLAGLNLRLEQLSSLDGGDVTHLKYRVLK